MKPDKRARTAAAITLSKGKMYEYHVPEIDHIAIPKGLDLEMQFPMVVGTVGDFASETLLRAIGARTSLTTSKDEVIFAAQVLQAFDESLLNRELSFNLRLLSAGAFYLGDVPGNATVQISKLSALPSPRTDPLARAAMAAMDKPWANLGIDNEAENGAGYASFATAVLRALGEHFRTGRGVESVTDAIRTLRERAYATASDHELLMADLLGSVSAMRVANSAWTLLPKYSELSADSWMRYLSRAASIKEIWPSQRIVGEAGLYRGQSGVVQMPTSAGKSRATELVIRSAFLSGRTRLALVVAPFRALCQEIASDLDRAFKEDAYSVNQLSDAMQLDVDFDELDVFDVLDVNIDSVPVVLVLTPEKLLYTLRQEPDIVQRAGLVVYDEGHQFDTGTRGVTYELLLTSIKRMLPETAQSVLISAVIQNASAVASWLLNDSSRLASDKSLQARRLVAFVSFPENKTGQIQFNAASSSEQKFFIPRVIVPEQQPKLPRETAVRHFPTRDSGSVALYLALRLIGNGGVAIYAGRKSSAAKIVKDAVEQTFRRGISLDPPAKQSDADEIERFVNLYQMNFGVQSYLALGAALGIFAHHGNTPQGIRIAIEHAMRKGLIRLVVCTSTLAQGVNLPIRYLLVTSAMQGRELIKARDFHNLMGRAGRAGMYGEGTVIFTDHRLYDERSSESWRWENTVNLVNTESAEPTGSTLLSLLDPLENETRTRKLRSLTPAEFVTRIVHDWEALYESVADISQPLKQDKFSTASLREQLTAKKKIVDAIESFLMAYRGEVDSQSFIANARELAGETLAFSIASQEQKDLLEDVFESVAQRIERDVPSVEDQHRFGRTLLGIDSSLAIQSWVDENEIAIGESESANELLHVVWPLLAKLASEKRLTDTKPEDAIEVLAEGWLEGESFAALLMKLEELGATFPHGRTRRKLDLDSVVDICEQTFGFEFSLLLASIKESFIASASEELGDSIVIEFDLLQKRLKYGLPSQGCISFYEAGFSERIVAQALSSRLFWQAAATRGDIRELVRDYPADFEAVLGDFPSYFTDVFRSMAV